MCESSAAMPLPTDFDLPTEGYLLPSHGLALPECSWLPGHNKDSLHALSRHPSTHAWIMHAEK
jgi:hypothetical protein